MTRARKKVPAKVAIRTLAELGEDVVLAPERHLAAMRAGDGVPLGDLVVERRERIETSKQPDAIVLDTTHAREGVLDIAAALRDGGGAKSAKKAAVVGDLVVSRLRPYLRQIALVHPSALASCAGVEERPVALSTEFYVLAPKRSGEDLAFLLPFLLGAEAQAALADAQEGGHHPRVPRESLFALRVPHALVRSRANRSREVRTALEGFYRASSRLLDVLA
ncbi:hypothetical protein AKJ09_10493 [Labilithrix luteola]|uniref:Uncharacterized protein n=1 Tax=Labilithrix luteola TaxID=1391654 RepID=A0A0K1QEI7_9BACT|nr:hypothetical protein [Labilithrix luteola]AKV03830.1 hypothetical protein AKJ09_10493 [Labilithrix luteola]